MSPWPSLYTTGAELGLACRNVHANQPSHRPSFVALGATTYSASVVEVVVHSWSFDFHEIAPLPNWKQYLVVDFRLSTTGKVWVGVTDYAWVLVQTEEDAKVLCAHQVFEYMLDFIPIRAAWVMNESADDSYGVSNVRPCLNHHVHQGANCRSIRYRLHILPLRIGYQTILLRQSKINGERGRGRIGWGHVEAL